MNQITERVTVFKQYRFLLYNLVVKEFKLKYRRSILGILWSILNPLLMMLIISAVFANIFRFDILDFPVYYLTGLLVFNLVSESTNGAMMSVIGGGALIKKVYIPKYIFPLSKCLFSAVNTIFFMLALIGVMLIIGAPFYSTMLLFWIPLIYALIFSIGLSLILSTLVVFFRDVVHLYSVWITAWMFLTPIIYPIEMLTEGMRNGIRINPLYHFVGMFRDLVRQGELPTLEAHLICLGFAFSFLIVGLIVFKLKQGRFVLYI